MAARAASLERFAKELESTPAAKKLLLILFQQGSVRPRVGLESGIRYDVLDQEVPQWKYIIDHLVELGLVEKKVADRVIKCPRCGSIHVGAKLICPWCKSFDIEPALIIQHTLCGYVDTDIRFRQPDGTLKCPKCGRPLRKEGLDYIIIGRVFECLNCGRRSSKPLMLFHCRNCDHQFDYLSAIYAPVYEYSLTAQGKKLVVSGVLFKKDIIEALRSLGYAVESPGKLVGVSGMEHTFDILAIAPNGAKMAIDFAEERDPAMAVTSRMPKAIDAKLEKYVIVVAAGGLEASMVAPSQNIAVIDLSEPNLVERIVAIARELLKGAIREEEAEMLLPSEEEFFGLEGELEKAQAEKEKKKEEEEKEAKKEEKKEKKEVPEEELFFQEGPSLF